MSFHVHSVNLDQARAVAEKALKAIDFRYVSMHFYDTSIIIYACGVQDAVPILVTHNFDYKNDQHGFPLNMLEINKRRPYFIDMF